MIKCCGSVICNSPCKAVIHHGSGHQSTTHCDRLDIPHEIHTTNYGEFNQAAVWEGLEVFSDFFDEPPREKSK
ncbi:hypothetical protein LCGC14_2834360 [marine sediment metagenome]|uniref:Uncharacterized protein n=1 Tax=marine sediment metagenome TaxID=412755 RepID=A0A0F8YD52_9ZZZZ